MLVLYQQNWKMHSDFTDIFKGEVFESYQLFDRNECVNNFNVITHISHMFFASDFRIYLQMHLIIYSSYSF